MNVKQAIVEKSRGDTSELSMKVIMQQAEEDIQAEN